MNNDEYYKEEGKVVFTESFHLQRGVCCGNKCRHCPYIPRHIEGSRRSKVNKTDKS